MKVDERLTGEEKEDPGKEVRRGNGGTYDTGNKRCSLGRKRLMVRNPEVIIQVLRA